MTNNMQNMGRYGDTRMAHVAPGEMIVPRQVMKNNPKMAQGIASAISSEGIDPRRYMVGTPQNSINPNTGQPEFFNPFQAVMSFAGKALASNAAKGALTSLAVRKLQGKKAGLREALIGGMLGEGIGSFMGKGSSITDIFANKGGMGGVFGNAANPSMASEANLDVAASRLRGGGGDVASKLGQAATDRGYSPANVLRESAKGIGGIDSVSSAAPRVFKEDLMGIGELGSSVFPSLKDEGNILGKLLNTKGGEALVFGIGAELLAKIQGDDEEDDGRNEIIGRARRPFGHGMPTSINTMRELAQGGETTPDYFPRRNGGIMPSEGSGTKDDVPAMLMAGEFVLTKDAINGLGGGNQRQGIAKAYDMQNQLERKART